MSMKFFSNIQDFLHLYNPAPMVAMGSSTTNPESPSSSSSTYVSNHQQSSSEIGIKISGSSNSINNNDSNENVLGTIDQRRFSENGAVYHSHQVSDTRGILRPSSSYNNIDTVEGGSCDENGHLMSGSNDGGKKRKSVQFPVDDNLVTGFLEPRKPTFLIRRKPSTEDTTFLNLHEMLEAYLNACKKFKVTPSAKIDKQISTLHMVRGERQEILSLRGEKLTHAHVECLEEIFKRVQFNTVDFEYCFLDDEALISLSDMIEFYDSAVRLNLSFNQNIGVRGWQAFFRMLRKSPCLEHLNLRYTSLNERTVPLLARTLRTESSLVSLHLENCSLSGKSMLLLACAFKTNTSIRDLYFAENNLNPTDAGHLYQIILANTSIELLDLRNNQLQDAGLAHICDALKNPDSQAKSKLNTLVLWNNRLTTQGMIHLARALLENKTLKTLNLGANNVGSEGVAIIKDSLARNRTLLRIGLQATKLNCQGAIAVAECIADNPILIRVDLRDNPDIKSAGLLALHVALRMNTSILALNLDKSCVQTSSLKSKEHLDHFKKLFDEIHTFCRRNHDLMVEKLKEEELRSKDTSPSDDDEIEHPTDAVNGVSENLPVVPDVVDVAPDIVPENVTDMPENFTRLKVRKISLTCKESVDNIFERFSNMPRLEEGEENQIKQDDAKKSVDANSISSNDNVLQVSTVSPLPGIVSKTTPTDEENVFHPSPPRPASLPVTPVVVKAGSSPGAIRPGPRRFSVSKVDAIKKQQNSPVDVKPATLVARRATVDCVPDEAEEETFQTVRRLVSDMVHFCTYEAGELANTPIVPAHQYIPSFESTDSNVASSSIAPLPPTSESVVEVSSDVEHLVDDLVRFVDYETKSSKKVTVKKASYSKKAPFEVVDHSHRVAPDVDYERETEISLAVREVVRDLVKSVSVQLDRKAAGRSSLIIRNRPPTVANSTSSSGNKINPPSTMTAPKTKPSTTTAGD